MKSAPTRPQIIIFISATESFQRGPLERRKRSRRLRYAQIGAQKSRPGAAIANSTRINTARCIMPVTQKYLG